MKTSFFYLYRHLGAVYILIMAIGVVNWVVGGACWTFVMFNLQIWVSRILYDSTPSENKDTLNQAAFRFLGAAGAQFVSWSIFFMWFHLVGQKICYEVKSRYMKAILIQDNNWSDEQDLEKLHATVHTNLNELENSAGKNVGFVIYSLSCFVSGIIYAFYVMLSWHVHFWYALWSS